MKTKVINIVEVILFLSFDLLYFLQSRNITKGGWTLLILYLLLGILYFPLGFYTLRSSKFDRVYSVLYGLLFSVSLTGVFFALMNVDLSTLLLMLLIVVYIMAVSVPLILHYILGRDWLPTIIFFDRGITIRWLVYFVFMIYALYAYNWKS
jgi:hypothetical protein